jgi:hypothetical protein
MLTNIPLADFYQLASFEAPAAPIAVGGLMMMNEVGTFLEDSDIIMEMGYTGDECFLLVNLPFDELTHIVDKSRENVDNFLKNKDDEVGVAKI